MPPHFKIISPKSIDTFSKHFIVYSAISMFSNSLIYKQSFSTPLRATN